MSPAHHTREARWRILLLVAAVIAGVAIATGANGTPTSPTAPASPAAVVSASNAESSAWYCTGQSTSTGAAPGFLVMTNTLTRPVSATVTTVSDAGVSARHGALRPCTRGRHPEPARPVGRIVAR